MRIESAYSVSPHSHSNRAQEDGKGVNRQTRQADKANVEDTQSKGKAESSGRTQQGQLSEEERKEVTELKKRDREVKQHEMAHMAAAAGLSVSGARFEYKRGPDGVMYAVGGEVSIDTSPVSGDPQATLAKAQKIERAALAPVDPSPQDYKVAAQARQMAAQARMEMMQSEQEDMDPQAFEPKAMESNQQGRYLDVMA